MKQNKISLEPDYFGFNDLIYKQSGNKLIINYDKLLKNNKCICFLFTYINIHNNLSPIGFTIVSHTKKLQVYFKHNNKDISLLNMPYLQTKDNISIENLLNKCNLNQLHIIRDSNKAKINIIPNETKKHMYDNGQKYFLKTILHIISTCDYVIKKKELKKRIITFLTPTLLSIIALIFAILTFIFKK